MKIAYYCQHVLGVGHFFRSLEICRNCADNHQVTMILGGPEISFSEPKIDFLQLPGLRMDPGFSSLSPCDPGGELENIKHQRRRQLLSFIEKYRPDCLVIELYPFGRKAFRFELDPLLERVRRQNAGCKVFCSLRDILVEKTEGAEKFEQRAVDTLNGLFDGLLVHGDRSIVSLDQTFAKTDQLQVPVYYTGYVTPKPTADCRQKIRAGLTLQPEQKLVVASIGSGSVGSELLEAVVESSTWLAEQAHCVIQLFTGPYLEEQLFRKFQRAQSAHLRVDRFTESFIDWLGAADLSISMAGYNTCMNTLAAGVPALLYPFAQNREQRLRVEKLTGSSAISLIGKSDLTPERLAGLMAKGLGQDSVVSPVDLDGAARTRKIIENRD